MMPSPFLTRVVLHNYKSIAACDVRLGALTYLVGPNGAGKSNFLDALHFVAEALATSLDNALSARWGLGNLLHRNSATAGYVGIRLEFQLSPSQSGHYAFALQGNGTGGYFLSGEECHVLGDGQLKHFEIVHGKIVGASEMLPAIAADRLALVSASASASFRPVFDALSAMGIYNLNPGVMRQQHPPQDGRLLKTNGGNIASVLAFLRSSEPDVLSMIEQYLHVIVPSVHGVERYTMGPMETVVFKQSSAPTQETLFYANNMSDGTLRALGVLTALFQCNGAYAPSLVGLEEPETALHPAAFAAIREALERAAERRQVIVASHSPDLLDDMNLQAESILTVTSADGATRIVALDAGSREAIRTQLFSAGELLRLNQLAPDNTGRMSQRQEAAPLFGAS